MPYNSFQVSDKHTVGTVVGTLLEVGESQRPGLLFWPWRRCYAYDIIICITVDFAMFAVPKCMTLCAAVSTSITHKH